MSKVIELLKQYNSKIYPVSNLNMDFLDEECQDSMLKSDDFQKTTAEKTSKGLEEITNVNDDSIMFDRQSTFFSYFLDGTRRAYYICDMTSVDGNIVPILAGQIASAVIKRNRSNGKVISHKYLRKGILLLPKGGGGLNEGDADELKEKIEKTFINNLYVEFVNMRNKEEPKNNSLAKLNVEMQNLEINFLEELTGNQEVNQSNMVIVDGALQFQNIRKEKIFNLRYAIGLSKNFNLHLNNIIPKKEIGTLLINLHEIGDRTVAYKLKIGSDDKIYAFWYLRIRPKKYLNFPFAGIVKVEKVLVTENEKEDGLQSDEINNISRCLLLEKSVCSYGNDSRWASHIYPIYLTEQIQKNKFISDYIFKKYFY